MRRGAKNRSNDKLEVAEKLLRPQRDSLASVHHTLFMSLSRVALIFKNCVLTHLSLASLLWDIGKQNSPRCDAAERGVPSGAILFAYRIFIKN